LKTLAEVNVDTQSAVDIVNDIMKKNLK